MLIVGFICLFLVEKLSTFHDKQCQMYLLKLGFLRNPQPLLCHETKRSNNTSPMSSPHASYCLLNHEQLCNAFRIISFFGLQSSTLTNLMLNPYLSSIKGTVSLFSTTADVQHHSLFAIYIHFCHQHKACILFIHKWLIKFKSSCICRNVSCYAGSYSLHRLLFRSCLLTTASAFIIISPFSYCEQCHHIFIFVAVNLISFSL